MPAMIRRLLATAILLFAALPGGSESAGATSGERPETRIDRDVVYVSRPDGDLHADIHVPAGSGPFPAVITIHGGSWRTGWRWEMNAIARQLTARNLVVMNVTYRLVPAHHWPDQYDDVQAAVRWLRANAATYHVDPTRIGAWGYSAGAQLALLLAAPDATDAHAVESTASGTGSLPTSQSSRVQAVVGGGSPTDLREFPTNPLVTRYLNGTLSEQPAAYRAASPVTLVTAASPPTFLYHGRDDWIVDIAQSRSFAAALRAKGVTVELVELPRGHLSAFFLEKDVTMRAADFLQRYLSAPSVASVAVLPSDSGTPNSTLTARNNHAHTLH